MTEIKGNTNDKVDHPYDWIDPQAEYWATHKRPAPDYAIYDASKIDPELLKKSIAPGNFYMSADDYNTMTWKAVAENSDRINNPWANGRHAWAAIVWALILMLTFSVGVGS